MFWIAIRKAFLNLTKVNVFLLAASQIITLILAALTQYALHPGERKGTIAELVTLASGREQALSCKVPWLRT